MIDIKPNMSIIKESDLTTEFYYVNDLLHRKNEPAVLVYNKDNFVIKKEYWLNGKLHRDDGAAIIYYNEEKKCELKFYYLNDKIIHIDNDIDFNNYINTLILK